MNTGKNDMSNDATQAVDIWRVATGNDKPARTRDRVVREVAATVLVEDVGSFTIMCTPTNLDALAIGFLHSEGMIDDIDDVAALSVGEAPSAAVSVRIDEPARMTVGRNMIVASSCGFCGARTVDKALASATACGNLLTVTTATVETAMERLSAQQDIFRVTGGTHAAAVFLPNEELLGFAEDIGRHNALDKAIGTCLLERRPTQGCGALLSGRVSLEMVIKAARAGIELIAAVSAPSSLAIEAARRCNMTLCGFVRPGRGNVYTHPQRIVGLPA